MFTLFLELHQPEETLRERKFFAVKQSKYQKRKRKKFESCKGLQFFMWRKSLVREQEKDSNEKCDLELPNAVEKDAPC